MFGNDPREPRGRERSGAMLQVARVPETLRRARAHRSFCFLLSAPALDTRKRIEAAGVRELANRKFGELSGGEKQRALFALALCGNPDLLFLDEPTVGMDVEARRGMWKQIRALGRARKERPATTHYLEEAEALADRIVVLHHGRVIENGTAAEIKSRVAGQFVRCRTRLPFEDLMRFAHVSEVRREGGSWRSDLFSGRCSAAAHPGRSRSARHRIEEQRIGRSISGIDSELEKTMNIYWNETKYEFLKMLRTPRFALMTLACRCCSTSSTR